LAVLTHFPHPLSANIHGAFWMPWLMERSTRIETLWIRYLEAVGVHDIHTGRYVFDIFMG
jgi:hypothetical protein